MFNQNRAKLDIKEMVLEVERSKQKLVKSWQGISRANTNKQTNKQTKPVNHQISGLKI